MPFRSNLVISYIFMFFKIIGILLSIARVVVIGLQVLILLLILTLPPRPEDYKLKKY